MKDTRDSAASLATPAVEREAPQPASDEVLGQAEAALEHAIRSLAPYGVGTAIQHNALASIRALRHPTASNAEAPGAAMQGDLSHVGRLADQLDMDAGWIGGGTGMQSVGDNMRAAARAIRALAASNAGSAAPGDNWQQYAKEGESAQQCIERHRREIDGLLKLLSRERGGTALLGNIVAEFDKLDRLFDTTKAERFQAAFTAARDWLAAPIEAHSKSEFKRLTALDAPARCTAIRCTCKPAQMLTCDRMEDGEGGTDSLSAAISEEAAKGGA